jgi:hypothetical protein
MYSLTRSADLEVNDVRLSELKAVKDRRPFTPFIIRMADGREIRISHPEGMMWSDDNARVLYAVNPDAGWTVIDISLVTSLSESVPAGASSERQGGTG